MTIEAMKRALDALCDFDYDKRQSAITALRAAIEHAEKQGQSLSIKTWQERCEEHPDHNGIVSNRMIQARMQEEIDELREAIEQLEEPRQWQGLTYEEMCECFQQRMTNKKSMLICKIAEEIEAKLKEKNHD